MTVKEQLVELLRAEGYDFISACELAERRIAEISQRPPGTYTYELPQARIIFRVGGLAMGVRKP